MFCDQTGTCASEREGTKCRQRIKPKKIGKKKIIKINEDYFISLSSFGVRTR